MKLMLSGSPTCCWPCCWGHLQVTAITLRATVPGSCPSADMEHRSRSSILSLVMVSLKCRKGVSFCPLWCDCCECECECVCVGRGGQGTKSLRSRNAIGFCETVLSVHVPTVFPCMQWAGQGPCPRTPLLHYMPSQMPSQRSHSLRRTTCPHCLLPAPLPTPTPGLDLLQL